MTVKEIEKAVEMHFIKDMSSCDECPYIELFKRGECIKEFRKDLLQLIRNVEQRVEEAEKKTAKEILDSMADLTSYDHQPLKNYDFFKRLAKKYGVEVVYQKDIGELPCEEGTPI